jgi:uncharacterized protein YecT (DUF1311 family)
MLRSVILLAFSILSVSYLSAQQMNEPDSPCAGIAGTSDLVSCLWKAKSKAEAEMNFQYDAIKKRLDSDEVAQLARAQDRWLKYRDANCSAERSLYGAGTFAPPAYLACGETMTRQRTAELKVTYTVRLKD